MNDRLKNDTPNMIGAIKKHFCIHFCHLILPVPIWVRKYSRIISHSSTYVPSLLRDALAIGLIKNMELKDHELHGLFSLHYPYLYMICSGTGLSFKLSQNVDCWCKKIFQTKQIPSYRSSTGWMETIHLWMTESVKV